MLRGISAGQYGEGNMSTGNIYTVEPLENSNSDNSNSPLTQAGKEEGGSTYHASQKNKIKYYLHYLYFLRARECFCSRKRHVDLRKSVVEEREKRARSCFITIYF